MMAFIEPYSFLLEMGPSMASLTILLNLYLRFSSQFLDIIIDLGFFSIHVGNNIDNHRISVGRNTILIVPRPS